MNTSMKNLFRKKSKTTMTMEEPAALAKPRRRASAKAVTKSLKNLLTMPNKNKQWRPANKSMPLIVLEASKRTDDTAESSETDSMTDSSSNLSPPRTFSGAAAAAAMVVAELEAEEKVDTLLAPPRVERMAVVASPALVETEEMQVALVGEFHHQVMQELLMTPVVGEEVVKPEPEAMDEFGWEPEMLPSDRESVPPLVKQPVTNSFSSWFPVLATFATFAFLTGLVALLIHHTQVDIMATTATGSWEMPTVDFSGLWGDVTTLFGRAAEDVAAAAASSPLLHGGVNGAYAGFFS